MDFFFSLYTGERNCGQTQFCPSFYLKKRKIRRKKEEGGGGSNFSEQRIKQHWCADIHNFIASCCGQGRWIFPTYGAFWLFPVLMARSNSQPSCFAHSWGMAGLLLACCLITLHVQDLAVNQVQGIPQEASTVRTEQDKAACILTSSPQKSRRSPNTLLPKPPPLFLFLWFFS